MRIELRSIFALPLFALMACEQQDTPTAADAGEGGKDVSIEQDGRSKPPFDMSLASPEELERIKPGSSAAYRRVAPPLQKTSAAGTVGFLSRWGGNTCHGEALSITMDDEIDGNGTEVQHHNTQGTTGVVWTYQDNYFPWQSPGSVDTKFHFCRTDRSYLKQIHRDYVVLRLSASCPTNGIPFARIIDNEDNNNQNSYTGNIWPSVMTAGPSSHGWTRLEFCFVPQGSNPCSGTGNCGNDPAFNDAWSFEGNYPGSSHHYGAFVSKDDLGATTGLGQWPWTGTHVFKGLSDDEDNGNINGWDWYGMSTANRTRVLNIIRETPHTTYFSARTCM